MWHQEASKIEAACGSGAAAFRSGLMAVASGYRLRLGYRCGEDDR